MINKTILVIVYFCCLMLDNNIVFAQPEDINEVLKKAESSYDLGDYATAANMYEILISKHHINGHVFFNLGNAYYKLGQKGNAIAAYLSGKKFIPRDPDLTANLAFVFNTIQDKLDAQREHSSMLFQIFFWISAMSSKEQFIVGSMMLCVFFVLMFLYLWFHKLVLKILGIMFAVIYFVMMSGLVIEYLNYEYWGAINTDVTSVYSEPNMNNANILFELHDGAPFLWKKSYQDWMLIELSDGKKGWVQKNNVKIYFN